MIGVRMNTFNDISSEPEQDANSALTELDKGLRSGKVGEQCEAIVRFPRLFEKYPFPILINSSFLKLSDVFRMGNNFLRLWVLRVCQQSEKHLDKILNVDEFLRRVFSVLHSNDPVARALALRTLGAVAGIIPERQNVHHAIRRGLDSHDNVEVDAAIYATTRFAAHSNAFAVAMCNKLSDMVECESTAADRRAKLVRALRTVHGGAIRAEGVLKLLKSLLEKYPSSSLVRAAITALTHIAADTVVHVPDQVDLLLSIARDDARCVVRRSALAGLRVLARHAALWPHSALQRLANAPHDHPDHTHAMLCLQVMQILVECPAVCAAAGSAEGGAGALRHYCSEAAFSVQLRHAATAAHVLTTILVHCYEENLPVDGSDLMLALETLVIATGVDESPQNIKPLRMALQCMVKLSNSAAGVCVRTSRVVWGVAKRISWRKQPQRGAALLEALAALPTPGRYHYVLLDMEREDCIENPPDDGTALVLAVTIILQERAAKALVCRLKPAWQDKLLSIVNKANGWIRYRIARAALRYGHHTVAARILSQLAAAAPTEAAQRWLSALHVAASADAELEITGERGLEKAQASWQSAAGAGGLGEAGNARAAALGALSRAGDAARALCSQPPPAVAHAGGGAPREVAARAGAAAAALRRARAALKAAASKYAALARTAFHADDSTLRHYYICQHTLEQFAQFLDRITSPQLERTEPTKELKATTLEERIALAPSEAVAAIASKLFDNPTTGPGITHRHAEAVVMACRACCAGSVWARGAGWGASAGGAGAGAARAGVRLTLWPARASDHPAPLPLTHRLALKLEGVILPPQLISKRQKPRQVKGVQITVTATPHPRTNEKTVELTNIPPVLTAVQTVTPLRDFFSAQQLVSVPQPGLYTVAVEAALVDSDGELWTTPNKTSIVIKAHEEATTKGNTQTTRGRF